MPAAPRVHATAPSRTVRTTRGCLEERAFIARHGANFHTGHHLFTRAPRWKLTALHRAVRATAAGRRMEVAPGYAAVMREATRHSGTARA